MPDWKVAASLDQLRAQLGELAPRRSLASDGAIGDAAHATRDSDHNPWFVLAGQALVTARDFTHDPAGGLDCHRLAAALVASRDPRIKYVIWDDRFWDPVRGWRRYVDVNPRRTNPHTHHLHLSVVADARADSRIPWTLPGLAGAPAPIPAPEDDMTPAQEAKLDRVLAELDKMKAGVRLPGRSAGLAKVVDDEFGWTMTAAGIADTVLAELRALAARQTPAGGGPVDYDRLADALLDRMAARLGA